MSNSDKIEIGKALATFFAGILIFVGGFWTYSFQKSVDRSDKLLEKRQAAYESYLHNLRASALERQAGGSPKTTDKGAAGPISANGVKTKHDLFQESKLSIFVIGDDNVIKSAGQYQKILHDPNVPAKDKAAAFATLVMAMREDAFEVTDLSVEDVILLSPIVHQ